MSIYLDYNASTPVHRDVIKVMNDVYLNHYGNPDSRTHEFGINAQAIVEQAREKVANLLHVHKNEIVFTSGATESNNIAIQGLYDYAIKTGKNHIITTGIEHKSVLEPVRALEKKGFIIDFINPGLGGRIEAHKVLEKVNAHTLLVSVMHVNNETGIVQPIEEIGDALSNQDVFFHIDAAQSCGKLVEELQSAKYDLLSVCAHKMYGPQGIGALVMRYTNYKRPPVQPLVLGGGHEGGIRAGTLPVALIAGFGKACELAQLHYRSNITLYKKTQQKILDELQNSGVTYILNGDSEYRVPTTLNVSFPGVDSEALMLAAKRYCAVSNGSACTSHDYAPSHVLAAMGLPVAQIESSIRISWGSDSNEGPMLDSLLRIAKDMIM